jgi:pimeloyl-ACP methyl ester carboxylesterase
VKQAEIRDYSVRVDGGRVHYLRGGQGPVLVLISSLVVTTRTYEYLVERLAQHFDVVAVDPPGCGSSQAVIWPWRFERYAEWLKAFFKELAIERAALLVHSNSGPIGLRFAEQSPEKVTHLILADVIGAFKPEEASFIRAVRGRALDSGLIEPTFALLGRGDLFVNMLYHPATFFSQFTAAAFFNVLESARKVRVPTLILWGALDHTMPVEAAWRLKEAMPGAIVKISKQGSHGWIAVLPSEATKAIAQFVSGDRSGERGGRGSRQ